MVPIEDDKTGNLHSQFDPAVGFVQSLPVEENRTCPMCRSVH